MLLICLSPESNVTGHEIATISTFKPVDVDSESVAFNSRFCSFLLSVSFPKRFLFGMAIISGLTRMEKTIAVQIKNNVTAKTGRYFDVTEVNLYSVKM